MPDNERSNWDSSITDLAPSDPNDVRVLYNEFSSDYNTTLATWGYRAPNVVADYLAQHVATDAPVLDAGCGTGLTGTALAKRGFSDIIGSDLSPDSIAIARETGCYRKLHNLDLTERLPYEEDVFGGISCVGVFSYIPDLKPVLIDLLRVLAPGGTLVFTQREDHFKQYNSAELFDQLHGTGGFERMLETTSQPYLPGNPSFADDIGVHYFVWRKHTITLNK
ncbi:MAG: class I SAM-dependent methyltransferase [Gammaproteobacteria bacterium]